MAPTTKTAACVDMSRFDHLEAELHSTMSVLQLTIDDLQSTKRELQATITELASTKQDLNATKEKLEAKTKDIAFQAYLTKSGVNTGKYQIIKFDGVHYNAGNGYNTTTGKLTAPVSGTYVISAQAELYKKDTAQSTSLYIVQQSQFISGSYAETISTLDQLITTTTAITHVRQGEQIWIQTNHDAMLWASAAQQNHFNGVLISAH